MEHFAALAKSESPSALSTASTNGSRQRRNNGVKRATFHDLLHTVVVVLLLKFSIWDVESRTSRGSSRLPGAVSVPFG